MALWKCADCTAAYSVGAPKCPQCGSTNRVEEGEDMAKITVAGGPSIAGVTGTWDDDDTEPDTEGGEESSPGSSSSQSETTPSPGHETTSSGGLKRARMTASRTGRGRTGGSTARSTDTDQTTAASSETDSDD